MVNAKTKKIVDFFYRKTKKKPIVWVKDEVFKQSDEDIKDAYLSGSVKTAIMSSYGISKGIQCMSSRIGDLRKRSLIVFNVDNEKKVLKLMKEYGAKSDKYNLLKKECDMKLNEAMRDLVNVGNRYD